MAVNFRLDRSGIAELLKSPEVAAPLKSLGERVAGNVRAQGLTTGDGSALPVEVSSYTTDRAAVSVTITHAAGVAMQAKHGALTKAAAAAGLEVTKK